MRQLFFIVAFWILVVVAMKLAVSFPRSLLARVFFTPFGPAPLRGEARPDYLLRCARFAGSWSAQSFVLFAAGWLALTWFPALAASLFFLVLWAVVVPLLGGGSLVVALYALLRCAWIRSAAGTVSRTQG
jgi:hypothetical protein